MAESGPFVTQLLTPKNPPDKVYVCPFLRSFPGNSGKKKAHKHKLFCPVGPSFHRICPRDKPSLSLDKSGEKQGQTQEFSLFYTVEARFHRVCPWDKPGLSQGQSRGRRAAQKVYVKKVYVPFSLARNEAHISFLGAQKVGFWVGANKLMLKSLCAFSVPYTSLAVTVLGIGNGVGRQGRGNQPPYRRYGTDAEIQYRLREPHGLEKTSSILSKREADTEFQYRPHIVDTDTDCGRHFCRERGNRALVTVF